MRIRRSSDASSVLLRADGPRHAAWNLQLLLATIVILGLEVLRQVWKGVRRLMRKPEESVARQSWIQRAARFGPLLAAATLAGWAWLFRGLFAGEAGLLSGTEDLTLRILQVAGAFAILLLPLVIIAAATAIREKGLRGLWPVLVGLACLAFAWFAIGFHLLGPSLSY